MIDLARRIPTAPDRLPLRVDHARLTSGRYAAIQLESGTDRREFVVATDVEAARGWIPADGRPRFPGLHPAFDAAHRRAAIERRPQAA